MALAGSVAAAGSAERRGRADAGKRQGLKVLGGQQKRQARGKRGPGEGERAGCGAWCEESMLTTRRGTAGGISAAAGAGEAGQREQAMWTAGCSPEAGGTEASREGGARVKMEAVQQRAAAPPAGVKVASRRSRGRVRSSCNHSAWVAPLRERCGSCRQLCGPHPVL